MSFNTSNIFSDTYTANVSLKAPLHLVDDIPIAKNNGNLKLGNQDNSVVECLELEVGTQLSAPIGILNQANIGSILPLDQEDPWVSVNSNLYLDNKQIANLGTLTLTNGASGTEGQVLSVDNTGLLIWKTDANDASQWASFPATENVDLADNDLEDANVINTKEINIQKEDKTENINLKYTISKSEEDQPALLIEDPNNEFMYLSVQGNIEATDFIWSSKMAVPREEYGLTGPSKVLLDQEGLTLYGETGGFGDDTINMNLQVKNVNGFEVLQIEGSTGNMGIYITDNTALFMPGGAINSKSLTSQRATLTAEDGEIFKVGSSNSGDFNMVIDNDLNKIYSTNNTDIEGYNNISCNKLLPQYKLQNYFFVSPNGDDIGGNGSSNNPFQTIQKAVQVAEALTLVDNIYRYVIITGGNYSENIAISKKIYLVGASNGFGLYGNSVGCVISGSIDIDVDTNGNDMFNNGVYLSGLLIYGSVNFISDENSMLICNDVYIYTADDEEGRGLFFNPSSTNSRLRLTKCQIISGGSDGVEPLLEITKIGSVVMEACYLSAKGNQNCLLFSGTANCDTIANCKFENSNNSDELKALVEITANSSSTYTFGMNAFFYSSPTDKSANSSSCGILNNNSSGNNNILINYNSFFLLGTNGSNYAVQDANAGTGTAMLCLYYFNNASLGNAFAINATQSVNKFQLVVVS